MAQVETASVSESQVIDEKAPIILEEISPQTVTGDNGYANVLRFASPWGRTIQLFTVPTLHFFTLRLFVIGLCCRKQWHYL